MTEHKPVAYIASGVLAELKKHRDCTATVTGKPPRSLASDYVPLYDASLLSEYESVKRERDEQAAWIAQATKTITNAIGGGSELFVQHGDGFRLDIDFVCKRITDMRERMIGALGEAVRAKRKANGIELSASFVEKRRDDYIAEHGSYDPSTNVFEYPGNGDEYVNELEEIIEGIRALAEQGGVNV